MTRPITFPLMPGTGVRRNAETGIEITNDGADGYTVRTFHADKGDMFESFRTLARARAEATEQVELFRTEIARAYDEAKAIDDERLDTRIAAHRAVCGCTLEAATAKVAGRVGDAHAEAAAENARRLVKRDGADALIHFWTQVTDLTPCGVNVMTTAYTYGSDSWDDVTCDPCRVAYDQYAAELNTELGKWSRDEPPYGEPINVGTLDNGAAVDAIRRDWTDMKIFSARAAFRIKQVTGVTTAGAFALLYADSVASLADGC